MGIDADNIRLVDRSGQIDGSWTVDPADPAPGALRAIMAICDVWRHVQPENDWHLEIRATDTPWNDWSFDR